MKIYAAGVGAAFAPPALWQTNFIIEKNGVLFAIDLGSDARHSFAELPLGINNGTVGQKIHGFWLSHLHGDHVGGLEWLALCSMFGPKPRKPLFYTVRELMDEAWDRSLRGGLETVEGRKPAVLDDFFECRPVEVNDSFTIADVRYEPVQMMHVKSGRKIQNSYGLFVTDPDDGVVVFFTTDTQFSPHQIERHYSDADLIIHDCETMGFKDKDGKWIPIRSKVHSHYEDLRTLELKHKLKFKLAHYNQPEPPYDARADGFQGFLKKGEVIDTAVLRPKEGVGYLSNDKGSGSSGST